MDLPTAIDMATANWTALCVALLVCVTLVDVGRRQGKNRTSRSPHPLPPGPPPLPIVGNVRGIDTKAPWLTYSEWSKVYGDLVYSRLFNQDIIIINSEKIAKDLLEDRSHNYSDRPNMVTIALFGMEFNTAFMRYGDTWRLHRRFFHQSFKADSVSRFVPLQQSKAHQLLRGLLESPELYIDHLFQYSSSIIMNSIYDYDPLSTNDHMLDIIGRVLNLITAFVTPEVSAILGAFPMILSIPSWFPGMGIKRNGELCRELAKASVEVPFKHALQRMNDGSTAPFMVYDALGKAGKEEAAPGWLQGLKGAAATAFAAGSETSNAALATFLLAMVLNPEVQEKAYAQVEAVVGKGRLPTLDDRPSLRYIDAIMRETLRWNTIGPLSVPHAVVNDDVYDGYHIPKGPSRFVVSTDAINFTIAGATVITNIWSMTHNESKYPKSFEFIPERFLNPDGTLTSDDVVHIAFGHGRRICAGRHFADITLWSAMSMILALFKLSVPKDEDGKDVSFEPKWTSGITSFVPRIPGMDANKLEELINAKA
ncbi:cytochrome P450 [Melanogaster broomeanus]|nr:cytochrome P450 [Melanogaster broomeanus]